MKIQGKLKAHGKQLHQRFWFSRKLRYEVVYCTAMVA